MYNHFQIVCFVRQNRDGLQRNVDPEPSCYSEPVTALWLTLCFYIISCISCMLAPGFKAEDSVAGDECGELPFSGEQNEAHDSLLGAGEGSLPEDHWTHAFMPSLWHSDRCGDDPDQNWSQRKSQNCSQKALTATGGWLLWRVDSGANNFTLVRWKPTGIII